MRRVLIFLIVVSCGAMVAVRGLWQAIRECSAMAFYERWQREPPEANWIDWAVFIVAFGSRFKLRRID